MATAVLHSLPDKVQGPLVDHVVPAQKETSHDVETVLNYYKEPSDGSGPAPTYAG